MPFLKDTTIKTIMTKPSFVDENDNLLTITKVLLQTKKGCVFVTRLGKLIGIISDRDIQRLVLKEGGLISPDITAKEFMVKPVVTIPINASIEEADHLMYSEKINRLAVVDKKGSKNVVGLIDYNTTHNELVTNFARSFIKRHEYFSKDSL